MKIDPIYAQIGAVLKVRRATLGLRQKELAATLGISRGALANIETGRQSVLVHQLYNFAAALQLRPEDLLPAKVTEHNRADRPELPLPADLKAKQKEQITRLINQVETNQTHEMEGARAKARD